MGIQVSLTTTSGQKVEATINGNSAIIGRSVKCDVVVPDESLSRQHCQVELDNGEFFVTDLGSANGVYLNGTRLEANTRTPFASFQQLALGPIECSLQETEEATGPMHIPQRPLHAGEVTEATTTRRINRDELKKITTARPQRTSKPEKKSFDVKLLAPVLIMAGAVYYFINQEPETVSEDTETTTEAIPSPPQVPAYKKQMELSQKSPDEFRLDAYYIENKSKVSCEGLQDYCSSLKLEPAQGEGLIKEGSEVFVYFNPLRALENDQFQQLKNDPHGLDLMLFGQLLPSLLMDDYLDAKVTHLHLILQDSSNKIIKVYRLHPGTLNTQSVSRMDLLTVLASSISEGNSQKFMEKINPVVKIKEITE